MKPITITTCAINVVAQPHPDGIYQKIFDTILHKKEGFQIRGDTYGKFASGSRYLNEIDFLKEKLPIYLGEMHFYTRISPERGWFNERKATPVGDDEDLANIKKISHLGPNDRAVRFVFFPKFHILVFETRSKHVTISPRSVAMLVSKAVGSVVGALELESIKCTIEPTHDQLEKLFSMSEVDALEVYLFRPNPDALPPDVEKEVFADLDANGIGEELTITKRSKLKSIQISPTRKKYIRVAARNGFVHASGRSDLGKKEKIATDEHPLEHTQTMIRKEGTEAEEANLFVQHCIRMYERIVKAIGGTDGRKKKANRKE